MRALRAASALFLRLLAYPILLVGLAISLIGSALLQAADDVEGGR